jgi:hypothetical protein
LTESAVVVNQLRGRRDRVGSHLGRLRSGWRAASEELPSRFGPGAGDFGGVKSDFGEGVKWLRRHEK